VGWLSKGLEPLQNTQYQVVPCKISTLGLAK
jgi:hypothetical protein